ncbi:MAG TPA: hypothetical protein VJ790_21470 [Dongiaceae bacterium]|nr:hypothetical protein [Dongiaceae bacterium]
MTTSKHPRKTSLGKLAAGALVAIGMVMAAGSSAMADSWKHGHGNGHGKKHWKHSHYHQDYGHGGYHYYKPYRPKVVYVQPRPVYVAPPPVYYYQPAPVYRRPEINIVFPLDLD